MSKTTEPRNLELVYPLYLDTAMMAAFLAALEGGVAQDSEFARRGAKSKTADGEAEGSTRVAPTPGTASEGEGGTLHSKHTEVSHFIHLRQLLQARGILSIKDAGDLKQVEHGALVEATGSIARNPLVENLDKILGSLELLGLELDSLEDDTTQRVPGKPTQLHGRDQQRSRGAQGGSRQVERPGQEEPDPVDALMSDPTAVQMVKLMNRMRHELKEADIVDVVMHPSGTPDLSVVISLSREFLSEAALMNIRSGEFTVLGKVTRKLEGDGTISLYQRSSLSYLEEAGLETNIKQLSGSGDAQDDESESEDSALIRPPALQVLPLAVYI